MECLNPPRLLSHGDSQPCHGPTYAYDVSTLDVNGRDSESRKDWTIWEGSVHRTPWKIVLGMLGHNSRRDGEKGGSYDPFGGPFHERIKDIGVTIHVLVDGVTDSTYLQILWFLIYSFTLVHRLPVPQDKRINKEQ